MMSDSDHDLLIRIDQRLTDLCVTINELTVRSKKWDELVFRVKDIEISKINNMRLLATAASATGGVLGFVLSSLAHVFGWKF